ncbi:MAG: bifunctional UDP-N-acetylglucosamine diphosphorylase/glucosamine-1-phosphate N-acetyltransferase GlmU [Anaerolineaceae bacterium]|nr:bifunctional UDP-N-acetylglucosamine diphosphorylase/glucosamine-1-phosphate N-acetyltransferase GlmU [Anaerolineaceae bacterium]
MKIVAVILAAGQGTRMRSDLPKVLHPLAGRPLIRYAVDAATAVTGEKPVVVIGHGAEAVQQTIGEDAHFVVQAQQLGTAHAVRSAEALLAGKADLVLVFYADMPLLTVETLQQLIEIQHKNAGAFTMLTVVLPDSHGFGRVLRNPAGSVQAIVEEAQATPEQLAVKELNVGAYCFRGEWLWDALRKIQVSPKGEYYLTDAVALAVQSGSMVQAAPLADADEAIGINTRVHLAEVEEIMRRRTNMRWMLAGVTMINPAQTYIEADVTLGKDTVLWPNTYLRGKTVIGENCQVGPNTVIENSAIGSHCTITASFLEGALVEDHVDIGPLARLRKGAHLAERAHMGNFGEIKNSYLGPGAKMGHFSYIGDAQIGAEVNIGAGTITCNYDGKKKHKTEIGAHAFIGSDTMLVAPIHIGENAKTGAGSVVTHDVPDGEVVVGVPARLLQKKKEEDEGT